MPMDIERAFKSLMKEGKVIIGLRKTKRALMERRAKMIVIANNCPEKEEVERIAADNNIPVYRFQRKGVDLGATCGKPFSISVFAVIDEGKVDLQKLLKES